MAAPRRRKHIRRGRPGAWLVAGGLMLLIVALAAWLLAERGVDGTSGAQPISRLSTRDYHALAFSPSDPDTIYFGHHGGLMVSRNGGRDWEPTSLQNADAMALAAPAANPAILYAAGHDVFFKSSDAGASWQPVATNLPGTDIHGFAADSADPDIVFAHVVRHGLFGSRDGGVTWKVLSTALPPSTYNLAVGENSQRLYATAGQAGLWRSTDGGESWTPVASLPGAGTIALTYDRPAGKLWVSTSGADAGLYVSGDDGSTWLPLSLKDTLVAIAVSPHNPDRIVVVSDQGLVYASDDGGLTWMDE